MKLRAVFFLSSTSNSGLTSSCTLFPSAFKVNTKSLVSLPLSLSLSPPFYFPLFVSLTVLRSSRRSITRFYSKPDFSRRKIHRNPNLSCTSSSACVLLHRRASVNVAAESSLKVSGLWIYVRAVPVHLCHSSCIQKCGNRDSARLYVTIRYLKKKNIYIWNTFLFRQRYKTENALILKKEKL